MMSVAGSGIRNSTLPTSGQNEMEVPYSGKHEKVTYPNQNEQKQCGLRLEQKCSSQA